MPQEGPLLTSSQTQLLITATAIEGFRNTKYFGEGLKKYDLRDKNEYKELLINLLFGPGKAIDKYILDKTNIDILIKEGILTKINDNQIDNNFSNNISNAYKNAYEGYRYLDGNRYMSKIASCDDIIIEKDKPTKKEKNETEKWKEKIKNGEEQLKNIIIPVIKNLFSIFGYYLHHNISLYSNIFNELYGEIKNDIDIHFRLSIRDIFSQMGLRKLTVEEIETAIKNNLVIPGISFKPYDMDNIWLNFEDGGHFNNILGKQIDVLLKDDPEKQFFLQAFWRTIIEFNQILELSTHEDYPLIMSENIHEEKQLKTITNKDEIRIYKIFLSERLSIPRLESLEDLLRLKEDKRILPLKNVINDWNEEYKNHNDITKIRERIQKDFALAEKEIKKLDKIKNVTGIISYVCIPVGIAELFTGTPISVISGGLSAIFSHFAGKKQKKSQWIYWGL